MHVLEIVFCFQLVGARPKSFREKRGWKLEDAKVKSYFSIDQNPEKDEDCWLIRLMKGVICQNHPPFRCVFYFWKEEAS